MKVVPPPRPSSPIALIVESEPHLPAAPAAQAHPITPESAPRAVMLPGIHSAPSAGSEPRIPAAQRLVPSPPPSYEGIEDSDVFVCRPGTREVQPKARTAASTEVTLFVHGWHNVEPGLLSWTFPSLRAALDAVQRMKNAIGWCVVSGTGWTDLDTARANGAILVEQLS